MSKHIGTPTSSVAPLLSSVRMFCGAWLAFASLVCAAQPVAVVVDTAGAGSVKVGDATNKAAIFELLPAYAVLQLGASGRMVVLYMRSGDEFTIDGPSTVSVGASQLVAMDGRAPVRRTPPAGQEVRLRPERVAQGGVVMRGVAAPRMADAATAPSSREIEQRRPASGATVAARVAYGLWLEDAGAAAEARAVWRELATEFPDQAALVQRAR